MARRRNDDGLFDFFPKRRGRRMMWDEPKGRRKRRDGLLRADLFSGGSGRRKKRGVLESIVRWVLRQPPDDFGWERRVRARQASEEPRQ